MRKRIRARFSVVEKELPAQLTADLHRAQSDILRVLIYEKARKVVLTGAAIAQCSPCWLRGPFQQTREVKVLYTTPGDESYSVLPTVRKPRRPFWSVNVNTLPFSEWTRQLERLGFDPRPANSVAE